MRVATVDAEHTAEAISRIAPRAALPRSYGGTCDALPADVRAALGIDGSLAQLRGIYDGGAGL